MLNRRLEEDALRNDFPEGSRKPRKMNDLLPDSELLERLRRLFVDRKELILTVDIPNRQELIRNVASMLNITQRRLKTLLSNAGPSVNLNALICRCRVEIACSMMAETNKSIEAIARECGFQNRMTFYRWFRGVKGCTPKAYMEQVNEARRSGTGTETP